MARRREEEDRSLTELLEKVRAGDAAAFEEIARRLTGRIYPMALKALASREAAEEATQDALVRIYTRIDQVKDPKALEGWAMRVAFSRINDRFRGRKRFRKAQAGLTELKKLNGHEEGLSRLERKELRKALSDSLEAIDEKHREVFLLREVDGRSHREVAELLGVPEGTVWSRLSYARKRLREELVRRGFNREQ